MSTSKRTKLFPVAGVVLQCTFTLINPNENSQRNVIYSVHGKRGAPHWAHMLLYFVPEIK